MADHSTRPKSPEAQEKLAAALRENLRRRKEQSRGRRDPALDQAGTGGAEPTSGESSQAGARD